jgi:hypothetical protein
MPKLAASADNLRNPRAAGALRAALLLLAVIGASACATIPNRPPRLEHSSYGCMNAVLQRKLPAGLADKQAHCQAAGLIARYCSPAEAYLAGAGKEWRDMFTGGDVEWADWQADRVGIACARQAQDDTGIARCCASREKLRR